MKQKPKYKTIKLDADKYEMIKSLAREAGLPLNRTLDVVFRHGLKKARTVLLKSNLIDANPNPDDAGSPRHRSVK